MKMRLECDTAHRYVASWESLAPVSQSDKRRRRSLLPLFVQSDCCAPKQLLSLPELSTVSEPLHRLTKRDTPWRWSTNGQSAFQKLKELLSADSILLHFDPSRVIGISCDASHLGIGAILFHRYPDGSERPITNASKTLTDTNVDIARFSRRPCLSFSPKRNSISVTTAASVKWRLLNLIGNELTSYSFLDS